ncbi:tryptophan synthase subunit beta [Oleiphilus messinensis]|uniref:Tryptophan synthase beta chain n=1 Tax=Oleiphilus messinensis TaxID=141451 RepID=A0A1Y0ICH2_9GAMM|nr:tryptophan synthase subunit beta [Oleiphilus messinensis]ARU57829.1 tryptophan synthase subunit beta [Oleiphilus messinensis]
MSGSNETIQSLSDQDRRNRDYFGEYGGRFIPELLIPPLDELAHLFSVAKQDATFWSEFSHTCHTFSGRPTPITHCARLSRMTQGAQIWLKREDLNHTGAHKINNVIGQGLLMRRMGKKRVVAETGAGQHGIATAIMAAREGFDCTIYMGAKDVERQYSNVFWMEQLGAEVIAVNTGSATLKDAMDDALRDWATNFETTHYLIGTACGPAPYPEMVAWFQSIIGQELITQCVDSIGQQPTAIVACVGGGSNALGAFLPYIEKHETELIAVEAGGKGLATGQHASRLMPGTGTVGIAQGYKTRFLQTDDGQLRSTHSIAAGLDYVGVSPLLADLLDQGHLRVEHATDEEALSAFSSLLKAEGIIPALESSHAIAGALKIAKERKPSEHIVVNLSGRGDKDLFNIANTTSSEKWLNFLQHQINMQKAIKPHQP